MASKRVKGIRPTHCDPVRNRGQSRGQSGYETLVTTIVGFLSSIALQLIVLPWYGIHVNLWQNVLIASITYAIAIPRGYILRRLFNRLHRQGLQAQWQSMIESGVDLGVGYISIVLLFWYLFPLFNANVSLGSNAQITAIFYAFAYVRKYILRRIFNYRLQKRVSRHAVAAP